MRFAQHTVPDAENNFSKKISLNNTQAKKQAPNGSWTMLRKYLARNFPIKTPIYTFSQYHECSTLKRSWKLKGVKG